MPPATPITRATVFRVYGGLLLLLALTALLSRVPLGRWSLPISLTIASGKLALIAIFFMRLKGGNRMLWIFGGAGFFWLGIEGALTFSDYLTRGWLF